MVDDVVAIYEVECFGSRGLVIPDTVCGWIIEKLV
jgi:hypothetical protein